MSTIKKKSKVASAQHLKLPDLHLECREAYLPSSFIPVDPPALNANQKSTSYLLTWRSAIYQDETIQRFGPESLESQQDQQESRRTLDELFPVTQPRFRILKVETDRHPLLDIIGSLGAREQKLSSYLEMYDDELNCYYAQRLGRRTSASRAAVEEATYRWFYPLENIEILSDYPFPGHDPSFGRRYDHPYEDELMECSAPLQPAPRRYYKARDGKPTGLAFVWEPFEDPETSFSEQLPIQRTTSAIRSHFIAAQDPTLPPSSYHNQFYAFDDPVLDAVLEKRRLDGKPLDPSFHSNQSHQNLPLFTDYVKELVALEKPQDYNLKVLQWRSHYVALHDLADASGTTIPEEDAHKEAARIEKTVLLLEKQRKTLRDQIQRRLFKCARGDQSVSRCPIPWHIPGGNSSHVCYPIRIGGFHGEVTTDRVFAMLHMVLDILPHEVILYSFYSEVDTTCTIELGLRYCEDALGVRALVHGLLVDDRLLEVQFLHLMSKQVHVVACPSSLPSNEVRGPIVRLKRVVALTSHLGLSQDLLDLAYALELDLSSWMRNNRLATVTDIEAVKRNFRIPLQNVLLSLPSLMGPGEYDNFTREVKITQSVSLGSPSVQPPDQIRLFCHLAMDGEMRFERSIKVAGRPHGAKRSKAVENSKKHKPIPTDVANSFMSSEQRQNLKRAIANRAAYLRECWRLPGLHLPNLNLEIIGKFPIQATVEMLERLWDWQDACMDALRRYRDQEDTSASEYDFSSFEIAFGSLARLDALRGPFYTAGVNALQARLRRSQLSTVVAASEPTGSSAALEPVAELD